MASLTTAKRIEWVIEEMRFIDFVCFFESAHPVTWTLCGDNMQMRCDEARICQKLVARNDDTLFARVRFGGDFVSNFTFVRALVIWPMRCLAEWIYTLPGGGGDHKFTLDPVRRKLTSQAIPNTNE
jgi:hypothetical protein